MKKSVSEARLAANRANALKSTGPRTPEGKRRVSRNALTHGLTSHTHAPHIPSGSVLAPIRAILLAHWRPTTLEQLALIDALAFAQAHLNHCAQIEDSLLNVPNPTQAFVQHAAALNTLARHLAHHSLAYNRAFKALLALRTNARCSVAPGPRQGGEAVLAKSNPKVVENKQPSLAPEPNQTQAASGGLSRTDQSCAAARRAMIPGRRYTSVYSEDWD